MYMTKGITNWFFQRFMIAKCAYKQVFILNEEVPHHKKGNLDRAKVELILGLSSEAQPRIITP